MRRRTVLERLQQEAELVLGLLGRDTQQVEDAALHVGAVDTDGAAADLVAVHDDVVRVRERLVRRLLEAVHPLSVRRGERVVHGRPTAFVIPLEHRRVHHPAERPRRLVDQAGPVGDLDAGRAEQLLRLAPFVRRGEEDGVARLGANDVAQPRQMRGGQVLGDRAARFAGLRVKHDVRQSPRAARLGPLLPAVQFFAGLRRAAGHDHRTHVATGVDRVGEHPELGVTEVVGEFGEL